MAFLWFQFRGLARLIRLMTSASLLDSSRGDACLSGKLAGFLSQQQDRAHKNREGDESKQWYANDWRDRAKWPEAQEYHTKNYCNGNVDSPGKWLVLDGSCTPTRKGDQVNTREILGTELV